MLFIYSTAHPLEEFLSEASCAATSSDVGVFPSNMLTSKSKKAYFLATVLIHLGDLHIKGDRYMD
jgi:hypothetical protein